MSRPCPPLVLCGWASVSRPCPPLGRDPEPLLLAAPVNSVAGLCGPASSCPPFGRAPELFGWALCSAFRPCPPLGPGSVSRPCPQSRATEPSQDGQDDDKRRARSWPRPEMCGWARALNPALCPRPVPPNSLQFTVVRLLSSSCPCLGRAPELCRPVLCPGLVLILVLVVSGSCRP